MAETCTACHDDVGVIEAECCTVIWGRDETGRAAAVRPGVHATAVMPCIVCKPVGHVTFPDTRIVRR
jgi:hypothetical protein